jgi:electron transfer flavoprotein alpha subunit
MIAVVPVRAGALPPGADETAAECDGKVLLVGSGTAEAAAQLTIAPAGPGGPGGPGGIRVAEAGAFAPGAWSRALAPLLSGDDVVVLPASADGRDLAPHLAATMARPLWAGAVAVTPSRVTVARYNGQVLVEAAIDGPAVATLLPGVVGAEPADAGAAPPMRRPSVRNVELVLPPCHDAEILELIPPTAATIDLTEAPRVFAGGGGLRGASAEHGPAWFGLLSDVAALAGASLGATRVAVDAGWAPADRQIGTTGVTIRPSLYVAFGISGAVQHVAGIGAPQHVISVNTDPSCPMMETADLAVVASAPAVLYELACLLGVPVAEPITGSFAEPAASEDAGHG